MELVEPVQSNNYTNFLQTRNYFSGNPFWTTDKTDQEGP